MVPKLNHTYHQLLNARYQASSPSQVAKSIHLAVDLYVDLLGIFHDPTQFNAQTFAPYPLEVIVDYLQQTHELYLKKSFEDIEASIAAIPANTPTLSTIKALSRHFFLTFRDQLMTHIEEEEKQLFPYIQALLLSAHSGQPSPDLTLRHNPLEVMAEHDHTLENNLKQFIMGLEEMHHPQQDHFGYRMLLTRLKLFELDLRIHGRLEEEVLIPRALQLQQEVGVA